MNRQISVLVLGLLCGAAAQADVVVIGGPAAAAMTKDQVSDVFLGKNPALTPVDQPAAAPIRTEFYQKVTGHDLGQVKATWSRLTFSGQGQPPKELADNAAVKKAVAANPNTIGYIDKSAVDGTVKVVLSVD